MLVDAHADLHVKALVEGGFGGGDNVWLAVAKVRDSNATAKIQDLCARVSVHVAALGVRDEVGNGQSHAAAEVLFDEPGVECGGCGGRAGGRGMGVVGKGG